MHNPQLYESLHRHLPNENGDLVLVCNSFFNETIGYRKSAADHVKKIFQDFDEKTMTLSGDGRGKLKEIKVETMP